MIGAVALSGVVVVGVTFLLEGDAGLGPLGPLAAFTLALIGSWTFPLMLLHRDETEAYELGEAILVAMILVGRPLGTVLAFAFAAVASRVVRRRPIDRVVFNAGMVVTCAGLALAAAGLAGSTPGVPVDLRDCMAAVIGAAVFMLANAALVAGAISLAEGSPFAGNLARGLGFRLLVWVATVAIGLIGGLAGSLNSWALLLAVPPMGVLQLILAGANQARRDRERLDGLLRAALQAHGSVEQAEVSDAVTSAARALLRCRTSEISPAPPGPAELGAPLSGEQERPSWLVVRDRRGAEPFDHQDALLLEALAAVGSGALHNAELVEQIRHHVFHDALTGLPNQSLFHEQLDLALSQLGGRGDKLAVLILDLDRFKRINDTLGPLTGDTLLCQVADRLRMAVGAGDTIARVSGNEFAVVLTGVADNEDAMAAAEVISDGLRSPFNLDGEEVFLTSSIGVSLAPEDETTTIPLLKNANTALDRAKGRGGNRIEAYAFDMDRATNERLSLERDLHRAVRNHEFHIMYQPQIDLVTGHVTSVEALARWDRPDAGAVSPEVFIPLAEDLGLIVALDDWVMRTACAQAQRWAESGLPAVRVAVNVSGRAFLGSRVCERVAETLASTGLEPHLLELEITESMAIDQGVDTRPTFRELERLGVRLAIDDFGTGYSALSRLQGFPFHTLKIDRSFVSGIEHADDEAPIVAAMIAMAHALGLEVVAEGVETSEQRGFLSDHACDLAQGYLFSRPVAPDAVELVLRSTAAA